MMPTFDDDFRPSWWLRNPHLQSMLASSSLRRRLHGRRSSRLEREAEWVTLDCGEGVRLTGAFTAQNVAARTRGLVVLFHGWEGSTQSTYVLQNGARLLAEGWDVFRLNFRDHGGSHGLNPGMFHSCRIDEVVGAVQAVRRAIRRSRWPWSVSRWAATSPCAWPCVRRRRGSKSRAPSPCVR